MVGQEKDYRSDVVSDIVFRQLWPRVIGLPLILGLTVWIVRSELYSLKHTAHQLARRSRDDSRALDAKRVPGKPDRWSLRLTSCLSASAACSSSSASLPPMPPTALRIQSEVALLAEENGNTPRHALNNFYWYRPYFPAGRSVARPFSPRRPQFSDD